MANSIPVADFARPIDYSQRLLQTSYDGRPLIFTNFFPYEGPVTLQALPYGGIQSVFGGVLIIYTAGGFLGADQLIYDNKLMSSEQFVSEHQDLVNQVLPN